MQSSSGYVIVIPFVLLHRNVKKFTGAGCWKCVAQSIASDQTVTSRAIHHSGWPGDDGGFNFPVKAPHHSRSEKWTEKIKFSITLGACEIMYATSQESFRDLE